MARAHGSDRSPATDGRIQRRGPPVGITVDLPRIALERPPADRRGCRRPGAWRSRLRSLPCGRRLRRRLPPPKSPWPGANGYVIHGTLTPVVKSSSHPVDPVGGCTGGGVDSSLWSSSCLSWSAVVSSAARRGGCRRHRRRGGRCAVRSWRRRVVVVSARPCWWSAARVVVVGATVVVVDVVVVSCSPPSRSTFRRNRSNAGTGSSRAEHADPDRAGTGASLAGTFHWAVNVRDTPLVNHLVLPNCWYTLPLSGTGAPRSTRPSHVVDDFT